MKVQQLIEKLKEIRELPDAQLHDTRIRPIIKDYFDQMFLYRDYDVRFDADNKSYSERFFPPSLQQSIVEELRAAEAVLEKSLAPGENDRNFYFYDNVRTRFSHFKLEFMREYHFTRPAIIAPIIPEKNRDDSIDIKSEQAIEEPLDLLKRINGWIASWKVQVWSGSKEKQTNKTKRNGS